MVGVQAEPDYQSAYRKLGGHHNLALFDIMQRRCSDIPDLEVMEWQGQVSLRRTRGCSASYGVLRL